MEGELKIRENPIVTKLDTPAFKSIFTEESRTLLKIFEKYGHEIRIAGGAVRDIIMDIHPKDIDFATTATPDEMKDMFTKENIRMINMKGEKHGTITPRINDKENFEVTTLRIDAITDGRHAEVIFTTDWLLDANRRDLTINSMFLGADGSVYDYFFGYEDLKNRRIAFVGNADRRIKEDYLRILRYFRFYGRIATDPNNHEESTIKAIKENVDGLAKISGERIWGELKKTLLGNFAKELILKIKECNMFEYIGLPKTSSTKDFEKLFELRSQSDEDFLPITYLIPLLETAEDAAKLHERLKLSASERDTAFFITQNRDKFKEIDDILVYKKLSLEPYARKDFIEELLKYLGKWEIYKEFKAWKIPYFKINGHVLKEKTSLKGEALGEVMKQLKLIWANDNFETTTDDLIEKYLPKIIEEVKIKDFPNKKVKVKK
ncbi:CCA tRNA nucleotidyltransferase 1, mitochondrial [Condylostylus longicornis]|uniref:CCA tRNA nucleotidyltransferase 1, mitochondrial n=1 Tax=Condylostylus longicornis TaxID=2530218 RepID=UPI00244DB646|nr:CCA tRNA nucleotidyltransferase 1, mitochondrial [Condylostylus longicornis]